MPRDVFRVVLDMLMPRWDPLRAGPGSAASVAAAQPGEQNKDDQEGEGEGSGSSSTTRSKTMIKSSGSSGGKCGKNQRR